MDSTIWWLIALGILVLGLIIAGIGVALFVSGMKEPLKKIKGSGDNLKERVGKLNLEVSSLMHTTSELQEEIAVKSEKVTFLMDAAKGTKNSVIDLFGSVRSVTDKIAMRVEHNGENVAQVKQLSTTAMNIVNLPNDLKTINHSDVIDNSSYKTNEQ